MGEETVVTVDSMLDQLTARVAEVEQSNTDLKQKNAELQALVDQHNNNGLFTENQLKKMQESLERLDKLKS